jgi:hypothetical protein
LKEAGIETLHVVTGWNKDALGKVRAIDIGHAWWQDLDSPETREHAGKLIAAQSAL